ncbi:hypothetical protein V6N13_027443 [Hibiscus sabdariffa]|uniref:Uncharacterized protein n=2 Tax=Hibiscus sabdariffa TaxID=183260 RepID=A0ABR2AVS3_9ROSI
MLPDNVDLSKALLWTTTFFDCLVGYEQISLISMFGVSPYAFPAVLVHIFKTFFRFAVVDLRKVSKSAIILFICEYLSSSATLASMSFI